MESLHDFFAALDRFVCGALGYMADSFFGSHDYREGFVAGIIFLVLVFGVSQVAPWAWRQVLVFFGPRPPSLTPGDPPVNQAGGCLGGCLVILVLGFLLFGMLWGLI